MHHPDEDRRKPFEKRQFPHAKIILRAGNLDIDGDLTVDEKQVRTSSTANLLGFDDELAIQPRLDVELDRWNLLLSSLYVDYEGVGTTKAILDFVPGAITSVLVTSPKISEKY